MEKKTKVHSPTFLRKKKLFNHQKRIKRNRKGQGLVVTFESKERPTPAKRVFLLKKQLETLKVLKATGEEKGSGKVKSPGK